MCVCVTVKIQFDNTGRVLVINQSNSSLSPVSRYAPSSICPLFKYVGSSTGSCNMYGFNNFLSS